MSYETITYTEHTHWAELRLNRPNALNALTHQSRRELLNGLEIAAGNPDIRAVVIAAVGKAFSVGQDLKEMDHDYQTAGVHLGDLVATEYVPLVAQLQVMPKPTIALVQGLALGGGMSLALACDFRVLGPEARFTAGFVNVGLAPDTGTSYLLPRMIGYAAALRIFLTGGSITAEEAVGLQLSDHVHATREDAEDAAVALAKQLAEGPTQAYYEIRRLLLEGSTLSWEQTLAKEVATQERLSQTEDHRNAVSSFLNRKTPSFRGQ